MESTALPPYELIRSRRRSVGLEVTADARLIIRAPERTPLSAIETLVQRHRAWIEKKVKVAREQTAGRPEHLFLNEEIFLYLGQPFVLRIGPPEPLSVDTSTFLAPEAMPLPHHRINLHNQYLFFDPAGLPPTQYRGLFERWYRMQAREHFRRRLDILSTQTGLLYRQFSLSGAQRRWGSCSPGGRINLSWRLIMAPPAAVDYVIIHELCHTRHPNHSSQFWQAVASFMPEYRRWRQWLREHGHTLNL
jgi:predicted metal-dependent hydrolase